MLISPPFLPLRTLGQSDADWVDMAMQQPAGRAPLSSAREGSFPLSAALMWHNGIHIQAQRGSDGEWPAVRAVASGTIVYVSAPSKRNDDVADPQNYNPFGAGAAWTDNGMVIVEHEAEIGASNDATGAPTAFSFYSACVHLSSVATNPATKTAWAPGDAIGRKDDLGQPGSIYGTAGQMHFEIYCDAASAAVILGRPAGWKENRPSEAPTSDGRTDAVFGSLWFYLPAGTPTRTTTPTQHRRATSSAGASAATDHFLPDTLRQPCWVELRYARGDATLTSRDADGQPVGTPLSVMQAEYDLYKEATRRHESYLKQNPASSGLVESSPSGWYELLRFGRNLGFGSGADPLPSEAAHWREIPTATGKIWADLNARGTFKFSDADFLPVAGWNCYDDDLNVDNQLCESSHLRRMLRSPEQRDRMASLPQRNAQTNIEDRRSIAQRLNEPLLQVIQRRAVCSFPSEWDRGSIEKRYEWVRDPMEKLGMEDEIKWDLLRLHLQSISMADLPKQYTSATWRFHPVEFIAFFRPCGWLGKNELKAIYSKTSETVRERYRIALNKVTRKYLYASSAIRLSHFFGQGSVESSALNLMQETSMIGNIKGKKLYGVKINPKSKIEEAALGHWYGKLSDEDDAWFRSDKYKSKGDLIASSYSWRSGNLDGDHAQKYRGRGFKQLTGLSNYSRYWVYRGWLSRTSFDDNWWTDQAYKVHDRTRMKKIEPKIDDPEKASSTVFNCIDTGGWYLGSERPETLAQIDKDSQNIAESLHDKKIEEEITTNVTKAINGGTIQNLDRLRETRIAKNILL